MRLTTAELVRKWRDQRRIIRKRLPRIQASDVVVMSYPKSGRTWLRVMISHVYHLRYGTPPTKLIEFDNLHALAPQIPKVVFENEMNLPPSLRRRLMRILPSKKVILLVRDPRDVVVSYYFHRAKRSKARSHVRLGLPKDVAGIALADFALADYGLPAIIEFMNRWVDEVNRAQQSLLIRYEDMRAKPKATLQRVLDFLGEGASDAELDAAVAFASFDSLKQKERQRFFESERMQPRDDDDPGSFKVRRGTVGGYRDYFDAQEVAIIDDLVATRLSPRLGYASAPVAQVPHGTSAAVL